MDAVVPEASLTPICTKPLFPLNVSYVCPEPVLAKDRFVRHKWLKNRLFRTCSNAPGSMSAGSKAKVAYQDRWHDCKILGVSRDARTCTVRYEDNGYAEEDVPVATRLRRIQYCTEWLPPRRTSRETAVEWPPPRRAARGASPGTRTPWRPCRCPRCPRSRPWCTTRP